MRSPERENARDSDACDGSGAVRGVGGEAMIDERADLERPSTPSTWRRAVVIEATAFASADDRRGSRAVRAVDVIEAQLREARNDDLPRAGEYVDGERFELVSTVLPSGSASEYRHSPPSIARNRGNLVSFYDHDLLFASAVDADLRSRSEFFQVAVDADHRREQSRLRWRLRWAWAVGGFRRGSRALFEYVDVAVANQSCPLPAGP